MHRTASYWVVLILLGSPLAAWAEVRTWTDKQGQTIRAEFIRVHEGRVVLKVGSKTQLVPLSQLSDQDQKYIENELNRKNRPKDGEEASQPVRIWTDVRGNQITASFVRINDNQVVLAESGKPRQVAFMDFSTQDRTHIKDMLRGHGQEEAAAALERVEEEAAKAAAAAAEAARQNAAAASAPPSNPTMDALRARQEQQRQEDEARRQALQAQIDAANQQRQQQAAEQQQRYQQQQQEAQQRYQQQQQETQQRMAEQQQRIQQQQQESQQRMQEQLASMSSGPTWVTESVCSNCRKTVPPGIGAGGNCPHCGVYFEYTEGPGGTRQYASGSGPGSSSGTGNFRISGRAVRGIFFVIVLICGGVAALWRKFAGS